MKEGIHIIDWPAPKRVRAYFTSKEGGLSQGPYASFNLAMHVEDNPTHVLANRKQLSKALSLPHEPFWLNQIHSNQVVEAFSNEQTPEPVSADASFTKISRRVCCVLTADCVPILICDKDGTQVAAIHAGWKGLASGIIGKTLTQFNQKHHSCMAWIGPSISQPSYTINESVYLALKKTHPDSAHAFLQIESQQWQADLRLIASLQLQSTGIQNSDIYHDRICTFLDPRFYSYRRSSITGRFASLIWLD